MTYIFDTTTRNQLDARLQAGDYPAAYTLLSDILLAVDPTDGSRPIDDPAVHQTQLFLEGAARINANFGIFADSIRDYTRAQGVFRNLDSFSAQELQSASDRVARAVMEPIARTGVLPTIDQLADTDAPAVRDVLFPNLNDLNPAWSGVAFFPFMGSDQFHRLDDPSVTTKLYNEVTFAFASNVTTRSLDPGRFTFEDAQVVKGLMGLWAQLADLGGADDLLDRGAAPSVTLGSDPVSVDDLVDFADLAGVTERVRVGDGGTVAGDDDAEVLIGALGREIMNGSDGADLLLGGDGGDELDGGGDNDVLAGGAGEDDLYSGDGDDVLDGGAGNDFLGATGEGPTTFVFGRGYGHDSMWNSFDVPTGAYDGTPRWAMGPPEFRSDDELFFWNLNPGDVELYVNELREYVYHTPAENGPKGLFVKVAGTDDTFYIQDQIYPDPTDPFVCRIGKFRFADGTVWGAEKIFREIDGYDSLDDPFPQSWYGRYPTNFGAHFPGTPGADDQSGSQGPDRFSPGGGADRVNASGGYDTIFGDADGADDWFGGGAGRDLVDYGTVGGGLSIDLAAGRVVGILAASAQGMTIASEIMGVGTDILVSIEEAVAGSGDDTLTGSAGANYLEGADGADTLDGGDGNDGLLGGEGDDLLQGGNGDDLIDGGGGRDGLDGGAGIDTARMYFDTGVTVDLAAGSATDGAGSVDALTAIENVIGTAFDDTLAGDAGVNALRGGYGDDVLAGRGGADLLDGGDGDDSFEYTGTSNGFDTVDGGAGVDTVRALASGTVIGLRSLASVAAVTAGGFSSVTVQGSGAGDTLNLTGTALTGIERVNAGGGDDVLTGSAGADTLWGGSGRDRIAGGAGNHVIDGGTGWTRSATPRPLPAPWWTSRPGAQAWMATVVAIPSSPSRTLPVAPSRTRSLATAAPISSAAGAATTRSAPGPPATSCGATPVMTSWTAATTTTRSSSPGPAAATTRSWGVRAWTRSGPWWMAR